MYTNVTDSFKEVVKSNVITTTARLTFKNFFSANPLSRNVDLVFSKEDISQNGLKIEDDCCYNGQIIGTAMSKEVEIEILNPNNYDLADKVFDLEVGVLTDREKGVYEFIPYGQYVVVSCEDSKTSNKYKIIANDLMIKLNGEFVQNTAFIPTFPKKLKDFYKEFMLSYGIEIEEQTLPNEKFEINQMPNFDGYSGRQVLMRIAELFGSFAKINRNNKCQMYLKTETGEKITASQMNSRLEIGNKYGPVNVVSIGLGNVEGENVTMQDLESIETYGETTIRIDDNPFVYSEELREQVIQDLFNRLKGFSYIPVNFKLKGLMYTDCGDSIQVENVQNGEYVDTIILNQYLNIPKTRQSTIESVALTNTSQKYKYISKTKQAQTKAEILVDKLNQEITSTAQKVEKNSEKMAEVLQTVDKISQKVENVAGLTEEINGITSITLENCMAGNLYELHIYGNNTVFGGLYPSEGLFPSKGLYPRKATSQIKVADKDGNEIIYELDVSLVLRQSGEYCDEFVIKDGKAYVVRRITLNDDGTVVINEAGVVENEREFVIPLAEGDNTISVLNYSANMYAKWVVKNDYTDVFATKIEMDAEITHTAQEITDKVTESIEDVNGELTTISSELTRQADKIEAKLDSDDFTSSAVIGLINNRDGTSTAKISATNVDLTGLVKATDLSGSGSTIINGDNIKTGTISADRLDTSKINSITGTIGGFTITSDSLDSATTGMSNGHQYAFYVKNGNATPYYVTMSGDLVCQTLLVGNYGVVRTVLTEGQMITNNYVDGNQIITTTANSLYITIPDSISSDRNLKENIKDTDVRALDIIKQLEFVQFDWKGNGEHEDIGVIAQEVEEISKMLVSDVTIPDGTKSKVFNNSKMLFVNSKSIQELNNKVEKMEEKMETLQEENAELKSTIEKLILRIENLEKGEIEWKK